MHPCAHVTGSVECCGAAKTGVIIRYKSYIANQHAKLILEYEVSPTCGDGLDFTVMLTSFETGDSILLFRQGHELAPDAPPDRQRIQRDINLRPDDTLDFVTHPRGSHDCDGVFIVDIQIWAKVRRAAGCACLSMVSCRLALAAGKVCGWACVVTDRSCFHIASYGT